MQALAIIAAIMIIVWGTAHIFPTRNIVAMYGEVSVENKRILTMEWIAEGLTLVFIGVLVSAITLWGGGGSTDRMVLYLCAAMLFLMAGLSALTGARTSILPMRICPIVKAITATLIVISTLRVAIT